MHQKAIDCRLGALASHLAVGDGAAELVPPVIVLGMTIASWAPRPEARRLPS